MITLQGVYVAVCFSSDTEITLTFVGDFWGLWLNRCFSNRPRSLESFCYLRVFFILLCFKVTVAI